MQFSERWLRALVNPSLSTGELTHLLTMSGLEVEACAPVAPPFQGVVVAEVLEVSKHPNADRLSVCKVDAGSPELCSVVCGAPNVATGMKVPYARVGAELPGMRISQAKVRGVESQGMLCSARELGLTEDHSGLLSLPADAPPGLDIRDYLALDDNLITIKLTPNRADCLSVLGVAREVAALTGARLTAPDVTPVPPRGDAIFPVKISDSEGCGRFTGRVIRGVDARAPTPAWMREALERSGQRSISALVDVTNFVMLELGRPLHVYDVDKLSEGIDIRFGRQGERVKLLNDQVVEVDATVLCITDASGPIGLAGIMGGDSTKADLDTRNVFLESAFFFPAAIAGRARRYNFASDASHRFERGVDYDNNIDGIERATRLILQICGGEAGPTVDSVSRLPARNPVPMRVARAHKVIGVAVPADEIARIFVALGLTFSCDGTGADQVFVVTPPSFRFDIEIEEDLIEEVARLYGFDRIPAHPPSAPAIMRARSEGRRAVVQIREQMVAADYQEVVNFSFVDEAWEADFAGDARPIRLLNPIASQFAVMRTNLIGGLVANVRYNVNRKLDRVRVFEIARVFLRDPAANEGRLQIGGISQPMRLGAIAYGPAVEEQWGVAGRPVDFFDVKGDLEALFSPAVAAFAAISHPALHPGRAARVSLDGRAIGWIGELHPKWQQKYELPLAPVVCELDLHALQSMLLPAYLEVSKFPPVTRDLAFVVADKVTSQALLDAMQSAQLAAVQQIRLFDVYRGKGVEVGQKSVAFRVVMQDTAKTLTDGEADAAMAQLQKILADRYGARLRT